MHEIFIGRQPIYDQDMALYAYELLYRSNSTNAAGNIDDDHATSQVILNAFTDFGVNRLVGKHRAFVNLPKSFITGTYPIPFSAQQSVLEVLENIRMDDVLIDSIKKLSGRGYPIALDDFIYKEELRPLVEIADIVKVDIMGMDFNTIKWNYDKLRPYNVKLLAEKIETREEFEYVQKLGFDYYQGYFFCRPNILKKKTASPNRVMAMQLLAKLHDPGTDMKSIAELVSYDVTISYKVLRYINSAFMGLPRKVESIQHAVIYLGLNNVRNLASLMVMSNIDDKPNELVVTAIARARMCENIATMTGGEKETYFTIGLLSVLDALMGMNMKEAISPLPLIPEIKQALLNRSGKEGKALQCVLDYERGKWDDMSYENIEPMAIAEAYLDAIVWADEAMRLLKSDD